MRKKTIQIGTRIIGDNQPVFIVAELGINHNGDIATAKKMIAAAKQCNVDAVKFQTFKADEFVANPTQTYTYNSGGQTITESMFEMFRRYELSKDEWIEIFEYCRQLGLSYFSSPQNPSDLDFLLSITNLPAIKVGSDDLTNLPLLGYYASKRIPMIVSTGMASLSEIDAAVRCILETGNDNLLLLHCVSLYPAEPPDVNLRKMTTLRQAFQTHVGFSDHTLGTTASIAAVALGAHMIEKHFTLDKKMKGPDHWFSIDVGELAVLVQDIRDTEMMLGTPIIMPTQKENDMRKMARRSIVAKRMIKRDTVITADMIAFKRPGLGLLPMFMEYIIGKKAVKDIGANEFITFDNVGP